jgi:hypothetical protein
VNVEAPVKTALVGNVVTAIDAGIAKISAEKCPKSNGLASVGGYDDANKR